VLLVNFLGPKINNINTNYDAVKLNEYPQNMISSCGNVIQLIRLLTDCHAHFLSQSVLIPMYYARIVVERKKIYKYYMFKITRSTFQAVSKKTTTRINGLLVHPKPKEALISIYKNTLAECKEMPGDAAYRLSVEAITSKRLQIVESAKDVREMEIKLEAGQIEEIIVQADDELKLARKMKMWKPWEPLEVKPADNQWVYFK
jgi:NADH dehydrogenase (ubiquinone) 1 alpha subcomplex subunit 5